MRASKLFVVAATSIVIAVTGCGDDDDGDGGADSVPATGAGATSTAGDGGASIEIVDFAFPGETRVAAGASVAVTNNDSAAHTVSADDGAFSIEVPPGETVELTAPDAGTYAFHCNFHNSMMGTLTVE